MRSSPAKNLSLVRASDIALPSLCHLESKSAIASITVSCPSEVGSSSVRVMTVIDIDIVIGVSEKASFCLKPHATATIVAFVSSSLFVSPAAATSREPTTYEAESSGIDFSSAIKSFSSCLSISIS